MAMPRMELTCIPHEVTLSCGKPTSRTTVRVRLSNDKAGVTISALGHNPAIATLTPAGGDSNAGGYIDIVVHCTEDCPCPTKTTVTFDAQGYDPCDLTIRCSDHKKEERGLPTALEQDEEDAVEAERSGDGLADGARKATRAGEARKLEGDALARRMQNDADARVRLACPAAKEFLAAGRDLARAARLQRRLGNAAAADALRDSIHKAFELAAIWSEACGDNAFEAGRLNAADAAYRDALEATGPDGDSAKRLRDKRQKIRELVQQP